MQKFINAVSKWRRLCQVWVWSLIFSRVLGILWSLFLYILLPHWLFLHQAWRFWLHSNCLWSKFVTSDCTGQKLHSGTWHLFVIADHPAKYSIRMWRTIQTEGKNLLMFWNWTLNLAIKIVDTFWYLRRIAKSKTSFTHANDVPFGKYCTKILCNLSKLGSIVLWF